jgi:hypothetical protein
VILEWTNPAVPPSAAVPGATLVKDSQVTDNELKASTDLIEELALFGLTKAQGAKRRFLNKLRKQLQPAK